MSRPPDSNAGTAAHARFSDLLERHLDGDLSQIERDELFEHLEFCAECQEVLEAEERLLDRLSQIPRLIPPSDLRAQILREAARERDEMQRTITSEERFASIFRAPEEDEEAADEEAETGVRFAGTRLTPRRRRTIWQRYSPIAAVLFLVFASLGALLTGNFTQIEPLAYAQGIFRGALHKGGQMVALALGSIPKSDDNPTPATVYKPFNTNAPPSTDQNHPSSPQQNNGLVEIASNDQSVPTADEKVAGFVRGSMANISSGIERLAKAADNLIPSPAEQARPTVAAIVIKPTDLQIAGNLEPEPLEETLAEPASDGAAVHLARLDSATYDGHRYYCYIVNVPRGWTDSLDKSLDSYRRTPEPEVVNALNEQAGAKLDAAKLPFYAAPRAKIKEAIHSARSRHDEPATESHDLKIFILY